MAGGFSCRIELQLTTKDEVQIGCLPVPGNKCSCVKLSVLTIITKCVDFHVFQVECWFKMVFPSVSYLMSPLANLLNRTVAKVESHFKEDADVTSNLEERIDLDVASIPLLVKDGTQMGTSHGRRNIHKASR